MTRGTDPAATISILRSVLVGLPLALPSLSFPGVINQFTPTQTDMKTMVVPRGTWTVTGTIAVPSGCTLIVEAGAVLRFQSGKGLTVSGSSGALPGAFFQAIGQDGTENGLAVFTSDSDSKGPGQWSRFLFGEGSRVMMQYCRVECGGQGFGEMINVDNGAQGPHPIRGAVS